MMPPVRTRFRSVAPGLLALAALALPLSPAHATVPPYRFQPFVDMAEYPPPDLGAIRTGGRVRHTTLGFVTSW